MRSTFAREALKAIEREDRKAAFAKALAADLAALGRIALEEGATRAGDLSWSLEAIGWSDDASREPGWTKALFIGTSATASARPQRQVLEGAAGEGEEESATAAMVWRAMCAGHPIGDAREAQAPWRRRMGERLAELRFGAELAAALEGSERQDRLGEEKAAREVAVERAIERGLDAELGEGGLLEGMLPPGSKAKARAREEGGAILLVDLFALLQESGRCFPLLDQDELKRGVPIGQAGDEPEEAWRGAALRVARRWASRGGPGDRLPLGEKARAKAQASLIGEKAESGKTKGKKPGGL